MRETVYAKVKTVRAMNQTAITTNASTDGVSIGLDQSGSDYRVATFVLLAGATITDGTYTLVPQESADGSTGWTDIPVDRKQGSAALTLANSVGEVGVVPDPLKPFIRLRVTSTSVTTGGSVAGVCLLGSPSMYPVVRP